MPLPPYWSVIITIGCVDYSENGRQTKPGQTNTTKWWVYIPAPEQIYSKYLKFVGQFLYIFQVASHLCYLFIWYLLHFKSICCFDEIQKIRNSGFQEIKLMQINFHKLQTFIAFYFCLPFFFY